MTERFPPPLPQVGEGGGEGSLLSIEGGSDRVPAPRLLEGITVLEYGDSVGIAFAARLLCDLGAEVVKVETPGGNSTRREGHLPDGADATAIFAYTNAGKRSVTLDTGTDEGRARLIELIEASDIVVDAHAPGHWAALGIDFDALPGRGRCRLAVSLTPFGRFGERAAWAANHMTVHHAGGEAYAFPGGVSWLKYPNREPIRVPGRVADLDAGWSCAVALLGWLLGDREPSVVETTVQEAAIALSRQDIVKFPNDGFFDTRATRSTPVLGLVECKDGWMEVYPPEQEQWERLVKAVDDPAWAHALGETADDRIRHTEELNDLFGVWLMERTKAEIYERMVRYEVPSGPVRTPREILEGAQMRYREFFQRIRWAGTADSSPSPLRGASDRREHLQEKGWGGGAPAGERAFEVPGHPYVIYQPDGASWRPMPASEGSPSLPSPLPRVGEGEGEGLPAEICPLPP